MKNLHFTVLDNGRLPDAIRDYLAKVIPTFAGKIVCLSLTEKGQTPSDKQRKYYFGVIVPAFVNHFADKAVDKDQAHDSMMRFVGGFGNPYVNPFTGEPDAGRKSFNDLTVAQAEGYFTLCRKWAAENGFDVPEPNEEQNQ